MKTMSCGAENYGLAFLTLHFYNFSMHVLWNSVFFYTFAAKLLTINF